MAKTIPVSFLGGPLDQKVYDVETDLHGIPVHKRYCGMDEEGVTLYELRRVMSGLWVWWFYAPLDYAPPQGDIIALAPPELHH